MLGMLCSCPEPWQLRVSGSEITHLCAGASGLGLGCGLCAEVESVLPEWERGQRGEADRAVGKAAGRPQPQDQELEVCCALPGPGSDPRAPTCPLWDPGHAISFQRLPFSGDEMGLLVPIPTCFCKGEMLYCVKSLVPGLVCIKCPAGATIITKMLEC